MFHLAVRMARHRFTSLLAVACAVLGGAALVVAISVLAESGLRSHAPVGRLAGADIVVTGPQSMHAPENLPAILAERNRMSADVASRLSDIPGVRRVIGDISVPAALIGADHKVISLGDPGASAHGWSSVHLLPGHHTDGTPPFGADEIALGLGAAAAANVGVGDDVRVIAAGQPIRPYRVSAVVRDVGDSMFFSDSAAAAFRGSGDAGGSAQVDLIALQVEPETAASVTAAVRRDLNGTGLIVSTGTARGDTVAPDVTAARSTLLLVAGSLAGIVVTLVGFVVTGAVSVSVAGQRSTLALIRSIGGTPRQVRSLVAAETTATAAVAALPGVALGYLLAGQLGDLMRTTGILPEALPLTFSPLPALVGVTAMVAVARIAARAASWRMSRMPAVNAMTESSTEPREPSRIRERIGLLVLLAAAGIATTPLFVLSEIGAAMTSTAGIVAAIGLAVAAPGILRRITDTISGQVPARVSAPTWLAVTNLRVFTTRFAGIITASAMLMIFTLTYAISQTTLLRASSDSVQQATTSQLRVTADALGGVPSGIAEQVLGLDGVRSAAPLSTTSVVWPHRVLGDVEIEAEPAMVLTPHASGVLDLDVREGSLDRLVGDTIAIGTDLASSRGTGVGKTVQLTLGDGTLVDARVVAVYARHLGLGSIALSRDLALQHTTSGLDQSMLVRTDDSPQAENALSALAASYPGLEVEDTGGGSSESIARPELILNIATIAVLLGYLALTIANRIVAVTTQRRGEIAALRTAGATRAQILGMSRREALIAAAVACGGALVVSAVPLVFLSVGFLGRPWPSAPVWLLPGAALLVIGLIVTSVELPMRYLLRSSPVGSGR